MADVVTIITMVPRASCGKYEKCCRQ